MRTSSKVHFDCWESGLKVHICTPNSGTGEGIGKNAILGIFCVIGLKQIFTENCSMSDEMFALILQIPAVAPRQVYRFLRISSSKLRMTR